MATYYTEREKKLMAEIQPIIKRLDYEQARKLERFFCEWRDITDKMRSLESDIEEFQRDYLKDETLAEYCKGLSEADTATFAKFLKDIKESGDHYVGCIYDDSDVHSTFEMDCNERYCESQISVTCQDGSKFSIWGQEAIDFNNEFHHQAKTINLNHFGQIRVTLDDDSTMDYTYGSDDANWIFDELGVEQIAAKD